MPEASLVADLREKKGKQAAKQLRREGFVPGVLYGPGEDPSMLSINLKDLLTLLHTFGRNTVVDLSLASNKKKKFKAFIYEIQHDPLSGDIIHVDLKHIDLTQKIHLSVPIHLEGVPEGIKNEGGILEHALHTVEILCLPAEIPNNITVDVSGMHMGDSIHLSDIKPGNFEITTDISSIIVQIVAPKIVQVEEEVVEEGLMGAEPAEPEVIGEEE
ncbi:MAG: 50S ribosomal protein L25 [Candidatus Latescibacteria bacterium]|nr:50S ribosomal protein L25 [Candidatus Latescibacterota bacterium]